MENVQQTETQNRTPKLYSPLAAIVITIGIYFGAQLLGGLILSLVPAMMGWTSQRTTAWLDSSTWAQFLFIAVAESLTLFVLWQFLKKRHVKFFELGFNKPQAKHLAYAISGFALYFVLYIVGLSVASKLVPGLNLDQKQELGFNTAAHGHDLWLIFISLVVLPPIVEEIVVRGFLFTCLRTRLTFAWSAVTASILFAAAHLAEGGSGGLLWVAGIDTFILSIVLCYLRERTKSLWPSIGVHMIKNGFAFVLLFNIFHKI